MRLWLALVWVVGLLASIAAGYAAAAQHPFADSRLDLVLLVAPTLFWILLGMFMGSRLHGPSTLLGAMPAARPERAELLRVLREHGLAGRRGRYRVPLYVLTGPPGMGKSSLLDRSGITFAAPVEIAGSTWWIADALICVEASTASETERLSALLTSWRPALPLNGVILAVSCADLTIADKVERRDIATVLARWLREFERTVGARLPVYMMLTKLDLTPGFTEFFDSLEPQDRRQAWGFTLPFVEAQTQAEDVNKAIQAGFRRLVDAVKVRLIECLSRETDPLRCGRIQSVGAQIATFESLISATLAPAIEQKSRRPSVQLRSVFLTSARQEALTIDVLLPELAERFALPRSGMLPPDLDTDEAEQGFFIAGALQKGVLPEAGLINRQRPWRRRRTRHATIATAIAIAGFGLTAFTALQYREGVHASSVVDERAPALARALKPAASLSLPAILSGLDALRQLRNDLPAAPSPPLLWPNDAVQEAAAKTYRRGLANLLTPHLIAGLEADLGDDTDLAALKGALAAAQPGKRDAAAFLAWLNRRATTLPDASRPSFLAHGEAAFRRQDEINVEGIYLDTARKLVAIREGPP